MDPPPWLDELTFQAGPPWHAMGTRALDSAEWLIADERKAEELALKRHLVLHRRHAVSIAVPGSERAQHEAATLISGATGEILDTRLAPLEAAALLVQEDLCVLVRRDGHWRLDAAVVCFPSMWDVRAKRGLPISEVHGPVPGYADELGGRVDRFIDRLAPDRPVWRRNWMVHATPELHLPAPPPPPERVAVPDDLWLRTERQTLRRLTAAEAVLFTIRTRHAPLAVLTRRPDVARQIAAAVRAWSPELVAYRGAGPWRDDALAWLDSAGAR